VNKPTYKITGDSQFELRLNRFTRWQHVVMLACGILAAVAIFLYIAVTDNAPPPSDEGLEPKNPPGSTKSPGVSRLSGFGSGSDRSLPTPREFSIWDQPRGAGSSSKPSPNAPRSGSTQEAQRALDQILRMILNNKSLTPEQAAQVYEWLKQISAQGGAAIPVLAEFLRQNDNLIFDQIPGGEHVPYGSLRLGLVDILSQMGTPEAEALAYELLPSSSNALEIALLSKTFASSNDETYRKAAMDAAMGALHKAAAGQWNGGDVSPLFETLQRFGNESVTQTLREAVTRWNYYATLSLAGLPEGAGIPTLIELSSDPSVLALGKGDFALRVLAQVSMQYPEARTALVNQARSQSIPDTAWPTVAAALGGNYIQYGIQIFGSTASAVQWTPDQINQRIGYIDQLMNSGVSPAGLNALRDARQSLVNRLAQL
jgi:hypothetical protein